MWIKICGVLTVRDAEVVASAGADAVGLNFYAPSKRFVALNHPDDALGIQTAAAIRNAVADRLEVVGVFVNMPTNDVVHVTTSVKLDTVQFHGDEKPQQIAEFHQLSPHTAIIRAFRIGNEGTDHMQSQLTELKQLNIPLKAVLVDALVPGAFGGTGHKVNATIVNDWQSQHPDHPPLILAGGLTPNNVAAAIADVQPWGIDTASGVETSPGTKSPTLSNAFCCRGRDVPADGGVGRR